MYCITLHQIYTACKQHGLIVSCNLVNGLTITFERTSETDILKPRHTLRVENHRLILSVEDHPFTLIWTNDHHSIRLLRTLPGLAPDHQSPQHILNALNDDCLLEIFLQLDKIDQWTVTQVCQRFQDVAMRMKPKHIQITNDNCTPLWKWEKYFRMFGASIETARVSTDHCPDIVMTFLTKYCTNLVELRGSTICHETIYDIGAIFPQLRLLHLRHSFYHSADIVFQPNAHIESIRVERVDHLPPIHLPKLRDLKVLITGIRESEDVRRMNEFFALNRQIEKLVVDIVEPFPISNMVSSLLNLQEFHVSHLSFDVDNAKAIGQLKRLHTLRLDRCIGIIVPTWRAFVENGVQLKHLVSKNWRAPTDTGVNYITCMRCLESLELDYLNDDELAQILRKCSNLKKIVINSCHITPRGIRYALMHAAHLETATFRIDLDRANSNKIAEQIDEIDAIAELRTNRMINIQAIFTSGDVTLSNNVVSFYLIHSQQSLVVRSFKFLFSIIFVGIYCRT